MRNILLVLILLSFVISSCKKENTVYNAVVLHKGLDCGNTYLIQFNEDVENIPNNTFQ